MLDPLTHAMTKIKSVLAQLPKVALLVLGGNLLLLRSPLKVNEPLMTLVLFLYIIGLGFMLTKIGQVDHDKNI